MSRNSTTRSKGNGAGYGGKSKGFTLNLNTKHKDFTADTQPTAEAKIVGRKEAIASKQEVLEMFTNILRTDESSINRMKAGENILDRIEGKSIARNLNVSTDDLDALDDAALELRQAEIEGRLRSATAGTGTTPNPARPGRVVN